MGAEMLFEAVHGVFPEDEAFGYIKNAYEDVFHQNPWMTIMKHAGKLLKNN